MMSNLLNIVRREVQRAVSGKSHPRIGKVTSYDPNRYCVKVELQPDGHETGWIPVQAPWVGNNWGIVCPPSPGDIVEVKFQEGEVGAGYVEGRFYSALTKPPGACPSGEFWMVHKSGSFLKFTNDGLVEIKTTTLKVTGDAHVTGNLTVDGTASTLGGVNFNSHKHGGVQSGGGDTSGPHN